MNPFNWFGGDREERLSIDPEELPQDRRPLVREITSVKIEAVPEGAILRAIGLPPTQGFWQAELVERPQEDPTLLVYEFLSLPPLRPNPVGTSASRELVVGRALSSRKLQGIKRIVVVGRQNQRVISR